VVLRERQERGGDAKILKVGLGTGADAKTKHEHEEDNIKSHGHRTQNEGKMRCAREEEFRYLPTSEEISS
jgi:hypothetical protein